MATSRELGFFGNLFPGRSPVNGPILMSTEAAQIGLSMLQRKREKEHKVMG